MTPLPRALPAWISNPVLSWGGKAGPALVPASSSGTVSPDVMPELLLRHGVPAWSNLRVDQ